VDGIAGLIKPHGWANAQFAAVFGEKCGVNGELWIVLACRALFTWRLGAGE